jgi:hypothetical protein
MIIVSDGNGVGCWFVLEKEVEACPQNLSERRGCGTCNHRGVYIPGIFTLGGKSHPGHRSMIVQPEDLVDIVGLLWFTPSLLEICCFPRSRVGSGNACAPEQCCREVGRLHAAGAVLTNGYRRLRVRVLMWS